MKLYNLYTVPQYHWDRERLIGRVFVINGYFFEEVPKYNRYDIFECNTNFYGHESLQHAIEALPDKHVRDGDYDAKYRVYDHKNTLARYRVLRALCFDNTIEYIIVRKIVNKNYNWMNWTTCDSAMTINENGKNTFFKKQTWIDSLTISDVTNDAKVTYYAHQVKNSYHHKFKAPSIPPITWICNIDRLVVPRYIQPTCKSRYEVKYFYEMAGQWKQATDYKRYLKHRDVIISFYRPKDGKTCSYYIPAGASDGRRLNGYYSHYYTTPRKYNILMERLEQTFKPATTNKLQADLF